MQGGAFMFINRLGSYHKNLSLEAFFKIKLIRLESFVPETKSGLNLGTTAHDSEEVSDQEN